ncbi:MAG: hypothetical protein MJ208_02875 [Bacilli bacterium]|nr:hypothetical protein [Bacilli bacterium]
MLKKLSKNELILYAVASSIAFIGLVFLLLGIIADNLDINSALNKAQASFPWRYIGLILILGAVIFALIVLLAYAKRIDRVTDRELRRKQRLSAMMSDLDKKEEIVVSEGKIVDNTPTNQEVEKEPEVETKPIDNMNEVK